MCESIEENKRRYEMARGLLKENKTKYSDEYADKMLFQTHNCFSLYHVRKERGEEQKKEENENE